MLEPVALPIPEEAAFKKLLHYAFTAPQPTKRVIIPKTSITIPKIIIAGSSLFCTWVYIVPSMQVGKAMNSTFMLVMQLLGNTIPSACIVANIGNHYFNELSSVKDAAQFTKLLKEHRLISEEPSTETKSLHGCITQSGKKIRTTLIENQGHILFFAALTAVPYGTAAYYYGGKLVLLKTGITFLIYTLVHTLPIGIILKNKILNFLFCELPIAPITLPFKALHYCTTSQRTLATEDKSKKILAQQVQLQQHLLTIIQRMHDDFKNDLIYKDTYGCHKFTIHLPQRIQYLTDKILQKTISSEECLELFTILLHHSNEKQMHSNPSTSWTPYILDSISSILGMIGGTVVGVSVLGWLMANIEIFTAMTGDPFLGVLLMVPTAIVTEVLSVYFGQESLRAPFNSLRKFDVPYLLKLSSALAIPFLAFTHFLNLFSWGTSVQLERDTFPKGEYNDTFRMALMLITVIGIPLYGAPNIGQLGAKFVAQLLKLKYFSTPEMRDYLATIDSFDRLISLIEKLEPKILQEIVNSIPEIQQPSESETATVPPSLVLKDLGLKKEAGTNVATVAELPQESWITKKCHDVTSSCSIIASRCWARLFYSRQELRERQIEQKSLLSQTV